ncbi:MAG: alanine/ornithine racemase family PLP-dependent enzyme [Yoonia sp.]
MTCPRVEVDLRKICQNTEIVVRRLKTRGITVTGVTKAVCGHPAIAQAMLDGGALGLAEARITNVQRLRKAGITDPITLIRTPMLSQAAAVVELCEASYNTQMVVISALADAAIRQDTVHGIILMVEMGDGREGIMPDDVAAIAPQVVALPGVALQGIGANFACLSGLAPDAAQIADLSALAFQVEQHRGVSLTTVSGGNSATLPWAFGGQPTGCINDLRLGEAILLGVDPVTAAPIDGLHQDAFTLIAEVIEVQTKPRPAPIRFANPTLAKHLAPHRQDTHRLILALGRQDTDISGLSMTLDHRLIGATSDHLVIGTSGPMPRVGSEIRFQMNYGALMQVMAAPDIKTELGRNRRTPQSPNTASKRIDLILA